MKENDIPSATVEHRRSISLIWVVPLVALIAGAFVAYRSITERGPAVALTFANAEGLEAGKTTVRYKDVEVGLIESIDLATDLTNIVCHVRMAKGMERYLNESTQFWVVRARIAGGQVSGLGTLLGGAYVGMQPGYGKHTRHDFRGLDVAPVVSGSVPGRYYVLRSQSAGTFEVGTPVFYQKISVGRVVSSTLDEDGEFVTVKVFVESPYDKHVRRDSHFWNASGIDASVGATGVHIRTESLASIVIGGIAFDTPAGSNTEPADDGALFTLYESYDATRKPVYTQHAYYLLYFDQSVRGLNVGAPVEFSGIPIGEVIDLKLEYDMDTTRLRIPVVIDIQPERIRNLHVGPGGGHEVMNKLVASGLRAQLKSGNLLTGQLIVALDIMPDAAPAEVVWGEPYPELPTVGTPLQEIEASIARIAERIDKVPFDRIGDDLHRTLALLNEDLVPSLHAAVERANGTLASVGPDSAVNEELRRALGELADAARALELTADELERKPQSLIFGKGEKD